MPVMSTSRAIAPLARDEAPDSQRALAAVSFFVAARAAGLVLLFAAASLQGREALGILTRWDAQWYAGIAENGYGLTKIHPDGRLLSDYAFFPLYPLLESVVSRLTRLAYADSGLLITLVAAPVAAYGIYRLVSLVAGSGVAFLTVALWGVLPISIVQTMAYTESLFTALAAWSLYHVQRGSWTLAGLLAGAAALARPTGVAVALAVCVAAGLEVRARWKRQNEGSPRLSGMNAPVVGVALAAVGSGTYLAWVATQTGSLTGYFDVTAGWENTFDGGLAFVGWIFSYLFSPAFPVGIVLILLVVGVVLLFVRIVRDRFPVPLVVYTGAMLVLSLGTSGYFGSKPRYLLPAFVLLVPVAGWLARRGPVLQAGVLVGATTISLIYGTYWLLGTGPP